jgi:putative glutamine amidotransferase
MNKPIILITPSFTDQPGPSYLIRKNYPAAIAEAGGVPLLMPYASKAEMLEYIKIADGVIFSGGGDMLSSIYGEEEICPPVSYNEERDRFDLEFFKLVYRTDIPVLAICRGEQVANVALGGTLWQDIPTQCEPKYPHRQTEDRDCLTHPVTVEKDSKLFDITGLETMGVNTFHHQSIKDVAPGLRIVAYSDDGIIEAVESETRRAFFLGTQWHPEACRVHEPHARILRRFIEEAFKYNLSKEI